jgi:hypothetical protein
MWTRRKIELRPIYACLTLTASSGVNFCCQPQFGRSGTRGLEGMRKKIWKTNWVEGNGHLQSDAISKEIDRSKMKKRIETILSVIYWTTSFVSKRMKIFPSIVIHQGAWPQTCRCHAPSITGSLASIENHLGEALTHPMTSSKKKEWKSCFRGVSSEVSVHKDTIKVAVFWKAAWFYLFSWLSVILTA